MSLQRDFIIDQNSDYTANISLIDINGDPLSLFNYTLSGVIKKSFDSETEYVLSANSVTPNTGNLTITLDSTISANMEPGKYSYDINMVSGNTTTRILEGVLIINPSMI